MNRSEQIDKLAEALAKAQGDFKSPAKDKTAQIKSDKGSYSYKYADLASTFDAVRMPLAQNGLSLTQVITNTPLQLEAVLMHASGQWISSLYPLQMGGRPQEFGSLLTYARRYLISCLLGIAADEDDDGAGAEGSAKAKAQRPAPPAPVIAEDHQPAQHAQPPQGGKPVMQAPAMSRTDAMAAIKAHGGKANELIAKLPANDAIDLSAAKSLARTVYDNQKATIAELIRAGNDLKTAIEKAEAQLQPA